MLDDSNAIIGAAKKWAEGENGVEIYADQLGGWAKVRDIDPVDGKWNVVTVLWEIEGRMVILPAVDVRGARPAKGGQFDNA